MSTWLEIVIKTLVEIRQSDEKTKEYYRYDNGISLHMIKKILGAEIYPKCSRKGSRSKRDH